MGGTDPRPWDAPAELGGRILKTEGIRHAYCHCTSPAESESPSWRPGVSLRACGCTDTLPGSESRQRPLQRVGACVQLGSKAWLCPPSSWELLTPRSGRVRGGGASAAVSPSSAERESCLHRCHPANTQGPASFQPPGEEAGDTELPAGASLRL